jgi:hypothetical protein
VNGELQRSLQIAGMEAARLQDELEKVRKSEGLRETEREVIYEGLREKKLMTL